MSDDISAKNDAGSARNPASDAMAGAGGKIGIVCGLKSEADSVRACLDGAPAMVGVSGADAGRAGAIARGFVGEVAGVTLSIGVSGGLDPALRPGDLIITHRVLTADGALTGDAALAEDITKAASSAQVVSAVFGSDVIIQTAEEKAGIFAKFGAAAVDIESHGAARAAIEAGARFCAIRAIADPAARALPPAAMWAVAEDGSTNVGAVIAALARSPMQLPSLLALGRDASAADKALRSALGAVFAALG